MRDWNDFWHNDREEARTARDESPSAASDFIDYRRGDDAPHPGAVQREPHTPPCPVCRSENTHQPRHAHHGRTFAWCWDCNYAVVLPDLTPAAVAYTEPIVAALMSRHGSSSRKDSAA